MQIFHWLGISLLALVTLSSRLGAEDVATVGFSGRTEIEKRLEAVHEELRGLAADADPTVREMLQQLEASCHYHLSWVATLAEAKDKCEKTKLAVTAWNGFPEPPPYSILLLDEIRENLATLGDSEYASKAQLRIFTAEADSIRDKLAGHQQAERRFTEVADRATSPESRQSAERSARIERISSRITAEKVAGHNLRLDAQRTELDMIGARKQLATIQLKAIEDKVGFSQKELDCIQQRIAREREEAAHALLLTAGQEAGSPLLSWKIEFLDLEKSFWDTRFNSLNKAQDTAKPALASLKEMHSRVDDWIKIAQLRLNGGASDTTELDLTEVRDALRRLHQLKRRIGFAIDSLEGGNRGTPVLDQICASLGSLWNTELYLAEETNIVEGRKVSTYRAVTIGKLVRLAFILTVGWLLLRLLSRRVKTISRKTTIRHATADLVRKWAFGLGLILLVLYGLNAVSIPLTALAFLGGALAIGLGFGTQTLLKNFISGIILLLERPLKVGDVIEVANITGTIKFIGMRASVIQHFDGIETLVPNSVLLENQLTNWTFSNTVIRHFILIGVAYGSPAREVARLLHSVASEHNLVKDDPAPEVRFDNFAENALTFSLLFWFDTRNANRGTLASDLRFMIDKAFAEAGIVIAFPQRDIHFDSETPLRVELSRPSSGKPKIEPTPCNRV